MSGPGSALYAGQVVHRRLAPKGHLFRYSVFSMLLDLDELDTLHRGLRLFSVNRFNLFSFFERDHGSDADKSLKQGIEDLVAGAGVDIAGGSISLLCYPRVLGYVFNPLSVYFCHDRDGRLAALLYEVTNTFGERHHYLFAIEDGAPRPLRHSCSKALYVSPFIGMEATYRFAIVPPRDRLAVSIREEDADGPVLNASFTARRSEITDARLARFGVSYFLMSLKIIGGIHWEALKLWRKGIRIHRHSPAAANRLSMLDQTD